MGHFDSGNFHKVVLKVTVVSKTQLTEQDLKGLDLTKELVDGVAQMKVLETAQLTTEQAAQELASMGKPINLGA
jgi:secreted protein with Ig-like and vWFA domain